MYNTGKNIRLKKPPCFMNDCTERRSISCFLAGFCLLLLFLLWGQDMAGGNSRHPCPLAYTCSVHKLGMKMHRNSGTQANAYTVFQPFPRTPKTHSLTSSICLAHFPALVKQSDSPVLQRNASQIRFHHSPTTTNQTFLQQL